MSKKYKNIFRYLFIFFIVLFSFSFVQSIQAQVNVGLGEIDSAIELSKSDPREIAARIINVVMLVLGVIALGLVLWGGFVWMTSNGEEDKIDKAKKILKNGVIGLIIVLSSWAIATFILTRLIDATGGGNGENSCVSGQVISCGCGGSMTCAEGSWGSCIGSDCGGGSGPAYCDSNTILPGCQAEDQICAEDRFCDDSSCMCVPKGGLGESCNADLSNETCTADNNRCAQYLSCHPETCTCYGPPVITSISPVGGFCDNNINQTCQSDDDCATTCNISIPNGAIDNLITINGVNFGSYDPLKSKVLFGGDVTGIEPSVLNSNCIDSWTNNQIIVAIPLGSNIGAIQVVTSDEQIDASNDENGPLIPDFVVNNIVRPGLCLLSPESGLLSDQVNYQGLNLYSAEAFFGNYERNVRGLDSVFLNPAGLDGVTTVPNLKQGKMSSFVIANIAGNQEKSNYVNFNKESEPNAGPFISYFEPVIGRAGQYVTIYGSGFGGARGFSQVYFGNIEADYDFPPICANSIWTDRQIIVKVPAELEDGAYQISVKLGSVEINSQNASPNVFIADANESLKTSICRISPSRGQIGSQVSIWGEYFGDLGGSALAVFTPNRSVSETVNSDQGAQRLNPFVPLNSASGPVKIVKGGEWGNVVNFEIGACVSDSECGAEVCCPAGTYKQNQCSPSLAECYINVPNSVFEWGFATGFGSIGTTTPYDSCQGMAALLGACQVNAFCPNSPGLCSPYQGGAKTVGSCDASCNSIPACINDSMGCTYDSQKDVCVLNNASCSLSSVLEYELNGVQFSAPKTCKAFPEFSDQAHWEVKIPTSCPTGWTRLSGNRCVDSTSSTTSSCSLCSNGFNCASPSGDFSASEQGVCVSNNLCPSGASCSGTSCIAIESARCDCCCEIGQDARDCCAPLVCAGTCGADTSDDKFGLGQCSGCAVPAVGGGFDTAASDQACNCVNHSGKYCDTSVPTGVCTDCSSLSREACLDHSQVCCLDSKGTSNISDDVCVGGSGQIMTNDPSNSDFGYCAYYNCQDESGDPSLCASDEPQKIGLFRDVDFCGESCASNPGANFCSQHDGDLGACTAASGCCFNYSNQKCIGGASISEIDGYCAYYNCQAAPNEGMCNPNPVMVGNYNNFNSCVTGCAQTPPSGAGQDCRSITNNTFECNTNLCSSPFACLNASGGVGLPGDCGACCCQVGNPESCAGLGSGNLVCQPNQTPCSGEGRGLCCGCSQDLDCGDAVNLGCDSGTCCRARPEVITSELMPPHGSNEICRNAILSIPFNQLMDVESVMNNLILLEEREYGNGVCPSGTFIASNGSNNGLARSNWFIRTTRRLTLVIKSIFRPNGLSQSALAHALPVGDKLYCSVPGSISVKHNGNGSVAEFRPKKLLSPSTKYYLIVKGDEALDSNSGSLSQWQVGMNGKGYLDTSSNLYVEGENISFNNLSFVNSYISSFITLSDQGSTSGLCTIDYVKTEPASYLFQNTNNDPNEDDSNPMDNTFDTKSDKDKVFSAGAYSADGQLLGPSQGYYWDWNWDILKTSVANFNDINDLAPNQKFVSAVSGVTDDSTIMKTLVNMDRFLSPSCNNSANCSCVEPNCLNNCCNVYEDGSGANVDTPLFIFVCNNPWPAVNPITLSWSPWYDTCEGATGNCANYNYKFYYCRDAGEEGIEDDLPAMINPAVILGASDSLVCSEGQTPCANLGATCGPDRNSDGIGDGFCIWSVLKESYFFKEAKPGVGSITAVIDQLDGQSARVEWSGNSSLIYNSNPSQMGKYRIYYAPSNTNNWSFIDVKPTDSYSSNDTIKVCSPSSPSSGENYFCQKIISNLKVDTTYVFKVSAISVNQVESSLSSEKSVLITDSTAPMRPQNFSASIINNQRFRFTWQANSDDTLFYRLYHGINPGQYGQSFDSNNNATSLEIDLRQFSAGTHYFALSALDSSGNESIKSIPTSLVVSMIVDPELD